MALEAELPRVLGAEFAEAVDTAVSDLADLVELLERVDHVVWKFVLLQSQKIMQARLDVLGCGEGGVLQEHFGQK